MKNINLILLLFSVILQGCSSKNDAVDRQKSEYTTIARVTGNCQTGFISLIIDGEEFCTEFGEYRPSLNSSYDNEERDDILKFWQYFRINSQLHKNWEMISFIGTISNLRSTGDYKLDNSAYDINEKQNYYSKRVSYIYIDKVEDVNSDVHSTANQYSITDSEVKITKFSKEKISGFYYATAVKGKEQIKVKGYFEDWKLSTD